MSWSLRVSNGDFVLDGAKLGIISSEGKLVQDLRHYLLEQMGSDPLHPGYGSLLDGGVMPSGQIVESPLGATDFRLVTLELEADIRRIALEYQGRQVERAKQDRLRYNRVTLTPGEILVDISGIDFIQQGDALLVKITLLTGQGTSKNIEISLPESPAI